MNSIRESEVVLESSPKAYRRRQHYVMAACVGAIAGLIAVAFRLALYASELGRERLLRSLHEHFPTIGIVVLPVVGLAIGIVVGPVLRLSPEAAGSGIPHLKGVKLGARQMNWRRLLPVTFIAGVLGIGAGRSLGREGSTASRYAKPAFRSVSSSSSRSSDRGAR